MGRRSRNRREAVAFGPSAHPLGSLTQLLRPPLDLTPVEDFRSWHPDGPYRAARQLSGHPVKPLVVKKTTGPGRVPIRLPHRVQFDAPARVVVCVRRQTRKEVLHALKKVGRGKGGGKKRRNYWSDVSC